MAKPKPNPLPAPKQRKTCPRCGGTGAYRKPDGQYEVPCSRCGGSGLVLV